MRTVNNIIRTAVFCFMVTMLPSGCLMEKDGPSAEKQSVILRMSVSAGEMTKAEPSDAEKVINSLRVYAFYGDALAGYASRQATALNEPFYMDLNLPESGMFGVDFYLIANESEMTYENGLVQLSDNMTREQIEAVRFTGLSTRTALPMYCVKTEQINVDNVSDVANTAAGHQGHYLLEQKVSFSLTRSLAKLSVYAAKVQSAASDPRILGVELLAAGTREYSWLFPQTDEVLAVTVQRANDRVLLSSPVNVAAAVEKDSEASKDPANYTMVLSGAYLPEVECGSSEWNVPSENERAAVLHVRYSLGESQDIRNGYVYLPRIERNNHIKVCILINAEGQIIVSYDVADWEWDENSMTDWFFDYPTHSYIWHEIPEDASQQLAKPGKRAEMSATQPFVGYFQMTGPENETWMPTLEGLNASDCHVEVYKDDVKVFPSDDGESKQLPVYDGWYTVKVYPDPDSMTAGEVVNLAVTYTPNGLTASEYLLVNGSHQDYLWEGSSSENYITITMVN